MDDPDGNIINVFELATEADAIALSVAISTAVIEADNNAFL